MKGRKKMDCPVCKENNLKSKVLSEELKAFSCFKCNGLWIRLDDYLKWLTTINKNEFDLLTEKNLIQDFEKNSEKQIHSKTNKNKKSSNELVVNCTKGYEELSEIKNDEKIQINDNKFAKICPDCGRILIKYKINNSIDFKIENCGTCSGNWFDQNKWKFLVSNNLHDKVYRFFTIPWQKKIRDESTKNFLKNKYMTKFGDKDYEQIKNLKDWLDNNSKKRELLAYLLKSEPYKL
jgi:Zn-finger nucleic acid-binding protein